MREVSSERLDVRLDPDKVPVELAGLVASFNAMLERIGQSFERLSNFSADIAHELRTPVTNLRTQTQVALSRARSADDYREILYSNLEEYERMSAESGCRPPDTWPTCSIASTASTLPASAMAREPAWAWPS